MKTKGKLKELRPKMGRETGHGEARIKESYSRGQG